MPSALLIERWPPLQAAAGRLGLAGLALLLALWALGRPLRPGVGVGAVAGLALTQGVLFYGATFYGIATAGASLAAVLANTDPLFVAGLAALVLGERLSRRQWSGLALGLAGAALVVWEGPAWPPALSPQALVVVGGALAWAIGTLVVARGVRAQADPLALAAWQLVLGGAALGVIGLMLSGPGAPLGPHEALLLVSLALLGSAVPTALFYLALARGPAGEVSSWFFVVPVVGVASAWPALGEQPGPRLLAGLAAVALGLWLVLGRRGRRHRGRLVDSSAPPVKSDTPARP